MMSAFADNSFSRQDITITSTSGDSVVYSPGLLKLPNDTWFMYNTTGVLSNWGSYDPEAKDIGLGLMFDPGEYSGYTESDLDRFVKLKIPVKQRTHWILGGWRKGFSSPVAPTGRDWANKVEELALQLRTPVHIEYLVE